MELILLLYSNYENITLYLLPYSRNTEWFPFTQSTRYFAVVAVE